MVFSVVVNNDKRWYTTKLLVSLEIPRGNFYAILGCTAVQGMVLDPSALNRA